jgi:Uma2 family endonuclease
MSTKVRLTTRDLESLPDHLDDTRYELIDGELSVAKQPHWVHQFTGVTLSAALLRWSEETGLGIPNAAPGLIFSPEDDVAPDVIWISNARLEQGLGEDGKLHLAPELAVEILSPGSIDERRDRELKLKLYAQYGVEEYWIADWRTQTIEVYRRVDNALEPAVTLGQEDLLTSPILPDFAFPVASLWRLARG